ncbi:MAG: sterol desaturase family protein, partial [Achromobacter pestifer]
AELGGRDYGRGFWSQQWLGIKRMVGRDRDPVSAPPAPPGAAERA